MLATLKLIFSLLPLLVQGIGLLETLFPAGGQGVSKLELLKTFLKTAVQVEQGACAPAEAILAALEASAGQIKDLHTAQAKAATPDATPASASAVNAATPIPAAPALDPFAGIPGLQNVG